MDARRFPKASPRLAARTPRGYLGPAASSVTSPLTRAKLMTPTPAAAIACVEALEPDEVWACYLDHSPETQEVVAAQVDVERWSQLLVREVRDRPFAPGAKRRRERAGSR